MASQSMILGSIEGIGKQDFNRLQGKLRRCFDEVGWKDGVLSINSSREHERLKEIFVDLSQCIQKGQFGSLLYVGHGNVACFYFGHQKYVGKRFRQPAPPDWWGA
jgi:hypothetical protein